ncbi:MAG TPA: GDYXXLXY domain-containing protein [Chryseolinea sp.]|nr:GDYXXLXY domain-containing protein [Chryseolinea sp.]
MRYGLIALFVGMVSAQWLVPLKMIYDGEQVVSNGTVYKFKTRPVDPSDPFRGKYITLNFEVDGIADTTSYESGELINIIFENDSAGYARPLVAQKETPSEGPYLQTTVTYSSRDDSEHPMVFFNLPFDRFYLEESKASEAERLSWQSRQDSTQITYGIVHIGSGRAVLTDVMINDKSIAKIVEEGRSEP